MGVMPVMVFVVIVRNGVVGLHDSCLPYGRATIKKLLLGLLYRFKT